MTVRGASAKRFIPPWGGESRVKGILDEEGADQRDRADCVWRGSCPCSSGCSMVPLTLGSERSHELMKRLSPPSKASNQPHIRRAGAGY
ncbi:hypothetical protein SUGI_1228090 [Cryptomeria japonica]|uniref:Uncharacterized protein n=1 Tax=Cryptomeria japonica TaxID=3369 RepID=A0AAD3RNW8_CRYJA|nr:hypothetical protein SUGI_1228090 [Cryptomeria japonica]